MSTENHRRRTVLSLQEELENWLHHAKQQDAIRIISGGPGSGKSSFARIFAASVATNTQIRVLFVPLHLIDPAKDFVDEVGRFVKDEGILPQNPLDPESPEPKLLIILDGLDELASQGKVAAEVARAFVREVERTVEKRNLQIVKLLILLSGRELTVQENESEFRHPRQILTILPYFIPRVSRHSNQGLREMEEYHDPKKLLEIDLRQQWWSNYGTLTGRNYNGLPKELSRQDLSEITAQPLLNYLVALSLTRDKLDFKKDINLNSIYADLVAAVYERGYEKSRLFVPIRHMKVDEFLRVLEEIGLAAWHGDGRTTTVREIDEHCRASGVGKLLDAFQEGAKAGVTRLLAAFFFRQYGQRSSGDPTFVFTHKSFGEYLTARRIIRAIERVIRELENRVQNPDEGWDEREALKHWAHICGLSAISRYLAVFLLNEVKLRSESEIARWQERLSKLFSYLLIHGVPMEQLQMRTFKDAMFQSRNAEEGLLVALNLCARITGQISTIEYADATAFGAWFKRIQGQRTSAESVLAADCLSYLDLKLAVLDIDDLYNTDLSYSNLQDVKARFARFDRSNLKSTSMQSAQFHHASFNDCRLDNANLERANLHKADLKKSSLLQASLVEANLKEADLEDVNLEGANLTQADLTGANLRNANLKGANLTNAKLIKANLHRADLQNANLKGANLHHANLQGVNLEGANLVGIRRQGTNLQGTQLDNATLSLKDRSEE